MKKIEITKMEAINAGDLPDVINGVCTAIALGGVLGWVALANPVGVGVSAACIVNTVGQGMDWW